MERNTRKEPPALSPAGEPPPKVDVPVVSDDHCRDSYGQNDIADSMICAGFDQG